MATSDISQDTASTHAASFKKDLLELDIRDVIRKHITTGDPIALTPAEYYELRRRTAAQFSLHPSAVVLVGSSRLGFSLKKKGNPGVRYAPFNRSSDFDVAVISPALFDTYWDSLFDLVRVRRDWSLNDGRHFTRDLFCGWITPSDLPNLPRFDNARVWSEFFNSLTVSREWGIRTIKGRLYKDWTRLEAYQQINVSECLNELRRPLARTEPQQ